MDEFARICSISPDQDYLKTLVEALLNGDLIKGFVPRNDPLKLSTATIYVPTRRAARALSAHFATAMGGKATLLPDIRPLGDIDEEALIFNAGRESSLFNNEGFVAVGNIERQILLAKLIEHWADALEQNSKDLFDEPIAMPASTKDAIWLASDLAALMDKMETEGIGWEAMSDLAPDEHAEWWKLTLSFLKIASNFWPNHLKEHKRVSLIAQRNEKLFAQAAHYDEGKNNGPVIAAGSTGSIPATAALLKAIAQMKDGAIILPGLDFEMGDVPWHGLENFKLDATLPSHPQFGLYHLLKKIGVRREDVIKLGENNERDSNRRKIISHALLPSSNTQIWPTFTNEMGEINIAKSMQEIALVEAPNEQIEALSIALILREVLEHETKTAALITPDRNLARRVISELKRFNINANDSAGRPLVNTPCGKLLTLLLEVCFKPTNPVALISLLKHPMCQLGWAKYKAHQAAKAFELVAVRGQINVPLIGQCAACFDAAYEGLQKGAYVSKSVKRLSDETIRDASVFLKDFDEALAPLIELQTQGKNTDISQLIRLTITVYNTLAKGEVKGEEEDQYDAYEGDDGETLSGFFKALLSQSIGQEAQSDLAAKAKFFDGFDVPLYEWPDVLNAFMVQVSVRVRASTHPRIAIWGPLEARLQSVDRVILSGLNEGTWPAIAKNDPFLSRSMKVEIDLEPPERRIGLAAHDFQMAMGNGEVFLTRAERNNNAPAVASRWLQRLTVVVGKKTSDAMRERGKFWTSIAQRLDQSKDLISIEKPNPKPAVATRPKSLSITEIETWIRDPYAIYAKHILKLEALPPIYREADARERGTLYHKIFERFIDEYARPYDEEKGLLKLCAIGREEFAASKLDIDVSALWWPRFMEIAENFMKWEVARNAIVKQSFVELSLKSEVKGSGFSLRGRIDRIDVMQNGALSIIDYKTGSNPSDKQVQTLLAPQLPLEGALTIFDNNSPFVGQHIDSLLYPRLRRGETFEVTNIGSKEKAFNPHQHCLDAWDRLSKLVKRYEDEGQGYLSRAHPVKENEFSSDYDHLARVKEWSIVEPGEDDS